MIILVQRVVRTSKSTISQVFVDDRPLCNILEDTDRELEKHPDRKIYGETAIPTGNYHVTRSKSGRFGYVTPILHNVKGYTGIRIHKGNKPENTEGCLLPGTYNEKHPDWVSKSKDAYEALDSLIEAAIDDGEKVMLEVS